MNESGLESKATPLDQFYTLSVIGKGAFAKVLLVRSKASSELFALKVIKKKLVRK